MVRTLPTIVVAAAALCVLSGAAPQAQAGCLLVGLPAAAEPGEGAAFRGAVCPDPVIQALPIDWFAPDDDDQPNETPVPFGWAGWTARVAAPAPGRSPARSSLVPPTGPAALLPTDGPEPSAVGGPTGSPDGGALPDPFPDSVFHPPRAS